MKKISIIFGTRPEAIKLVPLILSLRKNPDLFVQVCITGQHRHMLDQVLSLFDIRPDIDLDIMVHNQSLSGLTSSAIRSIEEYVHKSRPDLIIVQGDTTSVLCASIVGFYNKIPIAHVEAGLRTWDINSPFPEEMNRTFVSKIADLHFCPTDLSKKNLLKENILESKIFVCGNTVIDTLLMAVEKLELIEVKPDGIEYDIFSIIKNSKNILITIHRRENYGKGFESICNSIRRLANKYPDVNFIFPVHLNPNVQTVVDEYLRPFSIKNVYLIPPQSYLPFIKLMKMSYIILTDSGGIQEEGPSLGKPVLVLRESTERPEGVEAGTVKLLGTNEMVIETEVSLLIDNTFEYEEMAKIKNPYGEGNSSERITQEILNFFVGK